MCTIMFVIYCELYNCISPILNTSSFMLTFPNATFSLGWHSGAAGRLMALELRLISVWTFACCLSVLVDFVFLPLKNMPVDWLTRCK